MKTNIKLNISKALLALLLFFAGFGSSFGQGLNNGLIRYGNGNQNSIDQYGNLLQPFYFNGDLGNWYKLTYSNYALDYAISVGGDGTSEWNLSGTNVINPTLSNQVIDASGFTTTGAYTGYGTLTSTGTINVAGKNFRITQ